MSSIKPKSEGATRAGDGRYIFDMDQLSRMDAGPGYSSANGPVVEGVRIQVGLITFKRGTGARQVRQWLAAEDDAPLETEAFAAGSVALQGLTALEIGGEVLAGATNGKEVIQCRVR